MRFFTCCSEIGSNIVNNPSLPMILHHESVHAREKAAYKGFTEEAQRVAQAFPKLSIPEWYGKDLKIQLKFILQ